MKKISQVVKVDRRVQKTKRVLFEALARLITKKGYDNVRVQEIIDEANVGRSTFYAHYESKEQLLFSGVESLFSNLLPRGNKNQLSSAEKIKLIYEHAASHCSIAKSLLSSNTPELVKSNIFKAMLSVTQAELPRITSKDERTMSVMISEATAAALVRLLTNWLQSNMPFSPEVMAETSFQLITNNLTLVSVS